MRRGLQRADGFALFIAVCNRPADMESLIRATADSMPGSVLEVVSLDERTVDPLSEVLERIHPDSAAPVMILGLEKSSRSLDTVHPVLRNLNLNRPEWSSKLPRPVVLWIPEYLLGLLEREAPDFLDWRSDTLYFADIGADQIKMLADAAWVGGTDGRMAQVERRARIEELVSRLATLVETADPSILAAKAAWLHELGNQVFFFGDVQRAEGLYQQALEIYAQQGQQVRIAEIHNQFGNIAFERGFPSLALKHYENSRLVNEELGNRAGLATIYHQMGNLALHRHSYSEALELYHKSLEINQELGWRERVALSYHQLGEVAKERGSDAEATDWYQRSLAINQELGNQAHVALTCNQLGNIAASNGSRDEACNWYRKSLRISEKLGNRAGIARTHHQLGRLAEEGGSFENALESYRKSLQISEGLGYLPNVALNNSQIGILLTRTEKPEDAVRYSLRSLAIRVELRSPHASVDLHWLRRQCELLGTDRFRALLDESLDEAGAAAVLEMLEAEVAGEQPIKVTSEEARRHVG